MKPTYKIGVKFCGNCNPCIAAGELYAEIKEKVSAENPLAQFVTADTPDILALLVISGCQVDCASRPAGRTADIVIAGETLNLTKCSTQVIVKEVVRFLTLILRNHCSL